MNNELFMEFEKEWHHNIKNHKFVEMHKLLKFIFPLLLLMCFNVDLVRAQTDFNDEFDFKDKAKKMFEDGEFEQAYPLYSQLLSIYPKDPDYNYRFGVCTLFASDDKEKAIPFLQFAENKDVEKEVMYYLAKAYHLNYRFDDAIAEYTKYKKAASTNKANKLQVDRQIEMCKNGKQLLHNLTDLVVIEKKEMSREEFFRAYDISQIGGKLLVKPDEKQFRTSVDKKKKEKSIIYLSGNNNQVFFSSYGEDATKGKDIYTTIRQKNGEWSKPVSLGAPINTEFDEDFPFLHPNGKDLFFCSKGHNSMGGYDIFKSTYNETAKTWSNPVNLDFPINTPDDDILFVTDSSEKQAYFSSSRASITGKTEVYHINTERKPIDAAVIAGNVIKNRDVEKLNLKITVKNLSDNTIIGMYNSIPTDGSYGMNLPNGGKFLFTVESPDFPIQSEVVVIPVQNEFKPIKQEISYDLKTDKLIVKNIFETGEGDANYLMALKFIKEKAKLNVNVNEVATATKPETKNIQPEAVVKNSKPKPGTPLTNEDIIKIANDDAKSVEAEAKDAKEQADIALTYANKKNELAQSKTKEASDLFDQSRGSNDNVKKQELKEKANEAQLEAQQLNEETVNAFNLAKKLELSAESKQKEADLSKEYAKDLEVAVKSKNSTQAMAKLDEQEKKLEELSKENEGIPAITNSLKLDVDNKKKELDRVIQERNDVKQEIADNETIIKNTKADAESTKSNDLKKGLLAQIEELVNENKSKQKELEEKEVSVNQVQKEYNGIKNQNELINSVVEQAKTGSSEVAASNAAAIDKAKLEEKVNEIKKSIAANNTASLVNNTAESNKTSTSNKTETVAGNTQPVSSTEQITTNKESLSSLKKRYSDKLTATNNNKTELEREKAKAEVLQDYNKAVDENIAQQKASLKETTNTEEKRKIIKQISDAEQLSKEIKTQTNESIAKVTKLKEQTSTVAVGSAKNDSTKTETFNNKNLLNEDYAVINKKYSDEIAATSKIENETEREKAKSEILKDWDKTIDDKLTKQKEELKSITTAEDKKTVDKNIADAVELSKNIKSQVQESVAKLETLKKKDNSIASNENKQPITDNKSAVNNSSDTAKSNKTASSTIKIPSGDSFQTVNKKYKEAVTNADRITNEIEREQTKSDLLKSWNTKIDSMVASQKEALKKIKDTEQKKTVAKNIKDAEQQSKELKKQSDESIAKVTTLKKQQNAVASNTENNTNKVLSNSTVKNSTADSSKSKTVNTQPLTNNIQPISKNNGALEKDSTAVANTTNKTSTKEKQSIYSSPKALEQAAKADVINKQVQDLTSQANDLKTKAATEKNTETKVSLNEQAKALTKQAESKKAEAGIVVADANILEYKSNQNEIDQLANLSKNNRADDISVADMLNDESKIYFDKAQKIRKEADAYKSDYEKESALTDANTNETLALEKQKKAITIYKKYNPNFVASTTNVNSYSNPNNKNKVKTNNTPDSNKEAVANNKTEKSDQAINKTNPAITTSVQPNVNDSTKSNVNNSVAVANNDNTSKTTNNANTVNVNNNKETVKPTTTNTSIIVKNETTGNAGISTANKDSLLDVAASKIKNDNNPVPVSNETTASTTNPVLINKTTTFILAPNESFEKKATPVYSAKKPIPVNEKLPEGLVFKVQIGAFKKPIPQDLFKGITPITGETTVQGFTRYTAGVFVKFATADFAKNQIRDFGYKDAFVVAFLNGKRIPMSQAISMNAFKYSITQKPAKGKNNDTTETPETIANNGNPENNNQLSANNKEINEIAPATNISAIGGGLFYTVQVGVFSQPVSSVKLYNVTSLYTETAPNGNLRYNVGIFNNTARAVEAKNILIETGIKDAFVTAYYNGKRISLADAKQLEEQDNVTFSKGSNVNSLPKFAISNNGETIVNPEQPTTKTEHVNKPITTATKKETPKQELTTKTQETPILKEKPVITNESIADKNDSTKKEITNNKVENNPPSTEIGVIFKVQIGAFKDEVPLDIANKFLKVASKGIKNHKDENGLTIYTVGSYKTYEEASKMKNELLEAELTDAFIVAYKDGKKIPVEEAKQN